METVLSSADWIRFTPPTQPGCLDQRTPGGVLPPVLTQLCSPRRSDLVLVLVLLLVPVLLLLQASSSSESCGFPPDSSWVVSAQFQTATQTAEPDQNSSSSQTSDPDPLLPPSGSHFLCLWFFPGWNLEQKENRRAELQQNFFHVGLDRSGSLEVL